MHIYVCIYIFIYELCVFCLLQHCRNSYVRWSLASHSHGLFQLVLLVETAYTIVNIIQVINKEARAT